MTLAVKPRSGLLVVLSAPSGGGKTTVIRRLLQDQTLPLNYSISLTTRPRRSNEQEGVDYYFVDEPEFKRRISAGEVIEYEEVHGHLYGTPRQPIECALKDGRILLFDIDVKGALAIRAAYPEQSLLIFLQPPSLEELRRRLLDRGSEPIAIVNKRLQRVDMEMEMAGRFDDVIVNDQLERTIARVQEIVRKRFAVAAISSIPPQRQKRGVKGTRYRKNNTGEVS